ncbi:sensor histidine kinase [Nocardioides zeae]|uniref:histidine kinase n=1 Tax=Nocardioides zeae TaxID=1457234 RepID=A0A6P0HP06_9ACTN|nr:HAMP domain-containing sensor histidine kinase [Nocardioides zeae]NEN80429.1 HAMP domain-containing histidine kinase [Nocardioides zeae]
MPVAQLRRSSRMGSWATADSDDPRVLHCVFIALLLVELGVRASSGSSPSGAATGVALAAAVALTTVVLIPWARLGASSRTALLAVTAVVDIALIGASSATTRESLAVVLVGMPALWLGRAGRRGVVACAAASLTFLSAPALATYGPTPAAIVGGALPSLLAALVAASKLTALRSAQYERIVVDALLSNTEAGVQLVDGSGRTLRVAGRVPDVTTRAAAGTSPHAAHARSVIARAEAGERMVDELVRWGDEAAPSAYLLSSCPVHAPGMSGATVLTWSDVTKLSAAIDAQSDVVAKVTHDVRSPLATIIGYLDLLSEADLEEGQQEMVASMRRSSDRALRLVRDLLTSTQAGTHRLAISPAPTDLVEIVTNAVRSASLHAESSGIRTTCSMPDSLVVPVDPVRMGQVIENLLSNAIKYSGRGGSIHVGLDEQPTSVHLTVSDTGRGIAETDISRLFDPYFRAEQVVDSGIPGTGLGLSIVEDIVEAHGGSLRVESVLGEGSSFTVDLPRALAPTDAPVTGRAGDASSSTTP